MTRKKQRKLFIQYLRKELQVDFVTACKISKFFFTYKERDFSNQIMNIGYDLGFKYDYECINDKYEEQLCFTGKIVNRYKKLEIDIPLKFYDMRENTYCHLDCFV